MPDETLWVMLELKPVTLKLCLFFLFKLTRFEEIMKSLIITSIIAIF